MAVSRSPSTRAPGAARFAQLERLRRMIESGTYQVDRDALAARLVEEGVVPAHG